MAQNGVDHYKKLPTPKDTINVTSIISQQLQGLGFRYYWATQGLRLDDLNYRTTAGSRSIFETMEHIYSLCFTVASTFEGLAVQRPLKPLEMDGAKLRLKTLTLIQRAEDYISSNNAVTLEDRRIVFKTSKGEMSYPFLYLINGPLSDALTHVGQVLTLRRANGNPQDAGVNVFLGQKNKVN